MVAPAIGDPVNASLTVPTIPGISGVGIAVGEGTTVGDATGDPVAVGVGVTAAVTAAVSFTVLEEPVVFT